MSVPSGFTTRLRFEQASFGRDSSLVELRDDRLVLNASGYGHYPNVYTLVVPPPERWIAFWKKVDSLGVWKWKPEYYRPMLDGSNWSLDLEHEGRRLASRGSNAWPKRLGLFSGAVNFLVTGNSGRLPRRLRERMKELRRTRGSDKLHRPAGGS